MKTSYIASGLLAIGLGLTGTAYAETIEQGPNTVTVDNSTSPAAETYEGNDRNREVRYTNSGGNTDIGARDYRETAYRDNSPCGTCESFYSIRSEETGTVLNVDHGTLVNINAGKTKRDETYFQRIYSPVSAVEDDSYNAQFANGEVANDTVGFSVLNRETGNKYTIGNENDEGTGIQNEDSVTDTSSFDRTSLGAHAGSNAAMVYRDVHTEHDEETLNSIGAESTIGQRINTVTISGAPMAAKAPKQVTADAGSTGTYADLMFDDIGRSANDPAKLNGYVSQGPNTVSIDDSTSPAAQTYEGDDHNREVRYTQSGSNTDIGARDYRETSHYEGIDCGGHGCFGTNSRSEETGTVLNVDHGTLVNINAGETERTYKYFLRVWNSGAEGDSSVTSRFANGNVANDAVGVNVERRQETASTYIGSVNEDGTGVEGYDETSGTTVDLTSLDAHVLSNEVAVQHTSYGPAIHGVNLNALDAVEIGFDTVSRSPTVAFGPRMPMGGFLTPLFEENFATNAIANNGFAPAILGNGFVQTGLETASPITDLLPVGVPGQ